MTAESPARDGARGTARWLPVTVILLASLILSIPLFRDGLPYAHDTEEHLERYVCFVAQIARGEAYPRWLAGANGGLGSPVMFVYGPLAYYVPAALSPLLHFPADGAKESREVAVSMWLAMLVSGMTAYLWLKSFINRTSARTFGALLYMALPYHLVIDLYTRAAVSEVWAMAWTPLILYMAARVGRSRSLFSIAGLAVSYAVLVFTHLLTTLIFTPVLIGWVLVATEKGQYRPAFTRLALALALGAALAAAFLAPALFHEHDVSPERLSQFRPTLSYPRNFMTLARKWTDPSTRGDFLWKASWITLSTAVAAACGLALSRASRKRETAADRFWALVAAASLVMMFPVSSAIWKAIPQLAAIQFPYRFNTILCLAATALIASSADAIRRPLSGWRAALGAALAASMLLWAATDVNTMRHVTPGKLRSLPLMAQTPLGLDVLLPGWSKAEDPLYLKQAGILELSQKATVHGAGLKTAVLERTSARKLALVEEGGQGWVTLPLLYYPAWTARSGRGSKVNLRWVPENGLMEVETPPGINRIELSMPVGRAEQWGTACTAIAGLLTLGLMGAGAWQRWAALKSHGREALVSAGA